ncbi:hypothetical protein FRX31_030592 [Thalictrum thalictroides]|uniref:Uncharacterized protein n=1 Tax=Thalictrum thalictroides TaxID=46969 RepID=A0A7J6V4I0_THATH|nr:hypothetical protein FRX31_030592 [Thalictrum thalictroides]
MPGAQVHLLESQSLIPESSEQRPPLLCLTPSSCVPITPPIIDFGEVQAFRVEFQQGKKWLLVSWPVQVRKTLKDGFSG